MTNNLDKQSSYLNLILYQIQLAEMANSEGGTLLCNAL